MSTSVRGTAPAAAPRDPATLPLSLGHFVGGQPVSGRPGRRGKVYDPATGEVRAELAMASADETAEAIAAARRALPAGPRRRPCNARASCSGSRR